MKKEAWVESRTNELLPTPYYHVVFTLPRRWFKLFAWTFFFPASAGVATIAVGFKEAGLILNVIK